MVDPDFYRGFEYQIICSPKISSFHKGIIEITLFSQRSISYGLGSVSKQFRVPNMAGPRRCGNTNALSTILSQTMLSLLCTLIDSHTHTMILDAA